ncbi:related to oxidoreductase, 2OG-Fe(II) oxygenase family family [Lecanosticta acicola]|uniref:Related to oxidoreductase, 2OG-Fe(II) oxygenase family family n=1 Tax=Lecanosticta acicola TaxID=111012 RepID=A0AAI9ECV8_9PEZI|nr:related to oxidoreductase, 2OG-Fe(II) oxygenase family family [Lecanosticta acicola]
MSGQAFRYRTVLEVAVISLVIYFLLGAPGLSSIKDGPHQAHDVPQAKAKVENLVYPSQNLQCPRHDYAMHVFSADPLILYVDGFLSSDEAEHLIALSQDRWNVSTVFNGGVESVDDGVRKSEKARVERDHVVQCIEQRALAFQGWPQETFIERLWTQRYNISGHYALHYDWAMATKHSRRVSTFMVYVKDDCEGGGTNFPRLTKPKNNAWCEFIECGAGDAPGVTFKPRAGNAVFWMNFDAEGKGYRDTIHSGMPVLSGQKIGLNIWSWYQAGHSTATDV